MEEDVKFWDGEVVSSSQEDEPHFYAFTSTLVFGMFISISITVMGMIGNLLTIMAIAHQFTMPPRMRNVIRFSADTILILNLCVADFCYCAISLPVMFVIYRNLYFNAEEAVNGSYQALPNETCRWAAFIRYTNAITEWSTLAMMALERCVTIYRFQRKMVPCKCFTPLRTLAYCVSICLLAMVAESFTLTEKFGAFGYNNYTLKCDFMPTVNSSCVITPRIFFFALESAVPCCCILVAYVNILCQVYSSKHLFGGKDSLTSAAITSMALRRSKTTKLIVKLLTIYLVCIIPVCIYNVVLTEKELGETKNQVIGIYVYCLYWIQYFVNNFVYVLSNDKYWSAYKQLFSWLLCQTIELPARFRYLKTPVSKRVGKSNDPPLFNQMRPRTPSEMFAEYIDTDDEFFFSKSESKLKLTLVTSEIESQDTNEYPLLTFPKIYFDLGGEKIKSTNPRKSSKLIHTKESTSYKRTKKTSKFKSYRKITTFKKLRKTDIKVSGHYERSFSLNIVTEFNATRIKTHSV